MDVPSRSDVVVCSRQAERLCALLQRLGFGAHRIGREQVRVEASTVEDIRRFALLFRIPVLQVSAAEVRTHADTPHVA